MRSAANVVQTDPLYDVIYTFLLPELFRSDEPRRQGASHGNTWTYVAALNAALLRLVDSGRCLVISAQFELPGSEWLWRLAPGPDEPPERLERARTRAEAEATVKRLEARREAWAA